MDGAGDDGDAGASRAAGAGGRGGVAVGRILAYCRVASADRAVDSAQQRAWLLDFGTEVAETLQARAARGAD